MKCYIDTQFVHEREMMKDEGDQKDFSSDSICYLRLVILVDDWKRGDL
jgi:hypothetical protein